MLRVAFSSFFVSCRGLVCSSCCYQAQKQKAFEVRLQLENAKLQKKTEKNRKKRQKRKAGKQKVKGHNVYEFSFLGSHMLCMYECLWGRRRSWWSCLYPFLCGLCPVTLQFKGWWYSNNALPSYGWKCVCQHMKACSSCLQMCECVFVNIHA